MSETLVIASHFAGPPGAANGGVLAGTLAGERPAEVTIRRPVPVDTPLTRRNGTLLDGAAGEVLAQVAPLSAEDVAELAAQARAMPAVSLDEARAAGARAPMAEDHPFPTCFGCGPDHPDGLHCLAGPVGRDELWAVAFTAPEATPPYVWAALDCPSSAPHYAAANGDALVLGRIAAVQLAPLVAGERYAVIARGTGAEGRRGFSISVIQDAAGRPLAAARATWFALPR